MTRVRLNIRLRREQALRLAELAAVRRESMSSIVASALQAFIANETPEQREAAILRRLDQLGRRFDSLEQYDTIVLETLGLFIRHQLGMAPPVAEGHQSSVRLLARSRFAQFVAQVVNHLQRGESLVSRIFDEYTAPHAAKSQNDTGAEL